MVFIELSDGVYEFQDRVVLLFGLLDELCESYCQVSLANWSRPRETQITIPLAEVIDIDRETFCRIMARCNYCISRHLPLTLESDSDNDVYKQLQGRIPERTSDILNQQIACDYILSAGMNMELDDENLKDAQNIAHDEISSAISEVISYPNVKLILYALSVSNYKFTPKDLECIARTRDRHTLDKFKIAHASGAPITESLCLHLIDGCIYDEDAVKFALYSCMPTDRRFVIWAAHHNDLALVQHLCSHGAELDARACLGAVINNNLEMLMYLRNPTTFDSCPCPWNNIMRPEMAKYDDQLFKIPLVKKYKDTDFGVALAKKQARSPDFASRYQKYSAAELRRIRQPGAYICLCTVAAARGFLGILMYLRTSAPHREVAPWDEYTCIEAIRADRMTCLQYAIEKGCPYDITTLLPLAQVCGSTECLHYLYGLV